MAVLCTVAREDIDREDRPTLIDTDEPVAGKKERAVALGRPMKG